MPLQSTSADTSLRSTSTDASIRSTSVPGDPIGPFLGAVASEMSRAWSSAIVGTETFVDVLSSEMAPSLSSALAAHVVEPVHGVLSSTMSGAWSSAIVGTETFQGAVASSMAAALSSALAGTETFQGAVASGMAAALSSAVAGNSWTPAKAPETLAWWFRTDLSTPGGTLDGAKFSPWNDQSGNTRNISQATGSKQPTYHSSGGANGRAYISGTAAALTLLRGTWTLAQPVDVFSAVRIDATLPQSGKIFMDGGALDAMVFQLGATASTVDMFAGTTLSGTTSQTLQSTWQMWEGQFSGTSSKLLIAGSQVASGNAGTATTAGLSLFANSSGGGNVDCSYEELFAYTSIVSATTRTNARAYLQALYGVP